MNKPIMMPHGRHVRGFPTTFGGDQVAKLAESYRNLLAAPDAAKAKAAAIAADPNLSDAGKKAALRNWFVSEALPALTSARTALQTAENEAFGIKANLTRSNIDKTDIAAALLRQETRAWLRGMDPAKRNAVLAAPGMDASVAAAIAEAPAVLSGVTPQQYERLAVNALAANNPEASQKLAGIEEAALAVQSAHRMAALTLGEAVGLTEYEIEEAMGGPTIVEKYLAAWERGNMNADHSGDQAA